MLTRAIVRPPAPNFSAGLTTADLGTPNYERALVQHEEYCEALERCGLTLIRLEADLLYPDSTFVEDTAVLTPRGAILTRPGAPSRAGEVADIKNVLTDFYPDIFSIQSPGTVDGGDVCEAGDHFFIGISERTNEAARASWLRCWRDSVTRRASWISQRVARACGVPGGAAPLGCSTRPCLTRKMRVPHTTFSI